jgi:hypothetical protein
MSIKGIVYSLWLNTGEMLYVRTSFHTGKKEQCETHTPGALFPEAPVVAKNWNPSGHTTPV